MSGRSTPGFLLLGLTCLLATSSWLGARSAQLAQADENGEGISSYDVTIAIERGGAIMVTEVIDYDFGSARRHGIERRIPSRFPYNEEFYRLYPISLVSAAASPGTPATSEVKREGEWSVIKVGDPDRTISGRHRYRLAYRLEGTLNGFPDHDELYWNVIGTGWNVPIGAASARVSLATPADAAGTPDRPIPIRAACFAGPAGSTRPCTQATVDGEVAAFSQAGLGPQEPLTVVVGFPKGVVSEPRPILAEHRSLSRGFSLTPLTVAASLALLASGLGMFSRLAWRQGRDRRFVGSPTDVVFGNESGADQPVPLLEREETPVEFAPPDGIRPGQLGTLIDESASPLDVTATIVDLAVRGYLRIEEIPSANRREEPDWRLVRLRETDDQLLAYERVLLDALFGTASGSQVRLSDLRNHFARELREVRHALYADALGQGWFPRRPDRVRAQWKLVGAALILVGVGLTAVAAIATHLALIPLPVVVVGLALVIGAHWMPARTARGTAILRRALGFRRFIRESEAERSRFAEREQIFSEYLPYAIVFGCADRWARTFIGLDGQLPDTPWYQGTAGLSPVQFSSAMNRFTTSAAATIVSTPSTSGSSGFSGGFAGGGGGGGGGGSW